MTADPNFQSSVQLTTPLVNFMFTQDQTSLVEGINIAQLKKDLKSFNRHLSKENTKLMHNQLPPEMKRLVDLAKEWGVSSWLSVLPL